jgi:hypothetical protein
VSLQQLVDYSEAATDTDCLAMLVLVNDLPPIYYEHIPDYF